MFKIMDTFSQDIQSIDGSGFMFAYSMRGWDILSWKVVGSTFVSATVSTTGTVADGLWHHVVGTFQNANSGADDARAALYVDGHLRATMAGYQHTLTWDIESLGSGLGQRYVGASDDLLILDRALSAEAVADLFRSDQPAVVAWT